MQCVFIWGGVRWRKFGIFTNSALPYFPALSLYSFCNANMNKTVFKLLSFINKLIAEFKSLSYNYIHIPITLIQLLSYIMYIYLTYTSDQPLLIQSYLLHCSEKEAANFSQTSDVPNTEIEVLSCIQLYTYIYIYTNNSCIHIYQ